MKRSACDLRFIFFTVAGLLSIMLGGACAEAVITPFQYGSVEVTALSNGEPVPGIQLTLYTGTRHLGYGSTNDEGRFVFESVPAGIMGVAAVLQADHHVGLAPEFRAETFEMREGGRETVQLAYDTCQGTIRVSVVDDQQVPLPGVEVVLYTSAGVLERAPTDSGGTRVFTRLRCDTAHGVYVTPPAGYSLVPGPGSSYFDGLVLQSGQEIPVQFRLQRRAE